MLLQQELPWHLVCSALKEKQQPQLQAWVDTREEAEEVEVVLQLVDIIRS